MSVLETLIQSYVDKLCGESSCSSSEPTKESVLTCVKEVAFRGVIITLEPAEVVNPTFSIMLDFGRSRHIFN